MNNKIKAELFFRYSLKNQIQKLYQVIVAKTQYYHCDLTDYFHLLFLEIHHI